MKRYNPKELEPKWQKTWADSQIYLAKDFDKRPKFVMLTEFPYPSGDGLHMGHTREYTLGDIIARRQRMAGYNVLYPMGYDSFGLPTENYAIKNKIAPQVATKNNIANFQKQFESFGTSIDWSRSFATSDPDYYKWTQWLFLQFYKKGLAYRDEVAINWCPKCKTGLSNEEVVAGRHERCDTPVEKKILNQWVMKITDYADRLIDGLNDVDFPSNIADQQINWIGKSVGAEISFKLDDSKQKIDVFTTRPDTLFGVTFMVLAPEHPLIKEITSKEQQTAVDNYIKASMAKSEIERMDTAKPKTGVFTGAYAVNPANKQRIPVWIADYVLMGYGTGAIMAVPAHDQRDFEFAKKFDLKIEEVVLPHRIDLKNPPKDGKKTAERAAIHGLVYDPRTDKYLCVKWREFPWTAFVVGGVEEVDNGDLVEAAKREIYEETGYKNLKFIRVLGGQVISEYYAAHKDVNRKAYVHAVYFELIDTERDEPDGKEQATQIPVWLKRSEITKDRMTCAELDLWLDRIDNENLTYTGDGVLVNSGKYDGMESSEAREKIVADLGKEGIAKEKVQYKLRDWIFSRQHYWGEPIPIVYCDKCGIVPVPEDQLPVKLPDVKAYEPTDNGESPLAAIDSWVNTTCPKCGGKARRETDTMPNWAGSSWYYLRYFDAHNGKEFAARDKLDYWGEVDLYLGGMEHTTLHLLYSRFWHQFLYDQGLVPTAEPYKARRGQGIILAPDGFKMSKSRGNVINPSDIIDQGYGADSLRLGITFLAPYDMTTPWNPEIVAGTFRFLQRVWAICQRFAVEKETTNNSELEGELLVSTNKAIKKVSEDLEHMSFNTAIAALMEFTNELYKLEAKTGFDPKKTWEAALKSLIQLLAPFAPHISEELWRDLGEKESVHTSQWPVHDETYLVKRVVTIAVQVNGKLRGEIEMPYDSEQSAVEEAAREKQNVAQYLKDDVRKVIYVDNRLINFVV